MTGWFDSITEIVRLRKHSICGTITWCDLICSLFLYCFSVIAFRSKGITGKSRLSSCLQRHFTFYPKAYVYNSLLFFFFWFHSLCLPEVYSELQSWSEEQREGYSVVPLGSSPQWFVIFTQKCLHQVLTLSSAHDMISKAVTKVFNTGIFFLEIV